LLLISVGLLFSGWILKDRLPVQRELRKELYNEPIQTPSQAETFEFSYRGKAFKVTPVANYDLWNANLNSNDYRDVNYSSGDFTCYWSYHRYVDFHFDKIANNHLLSDSLVMRARIRQAEIGDKFTSRACW
jgi:hypothetical protein